MVTHTDQSDTNGSEWRRSSLSGGDSPLEVRFLADGRVQVRNGSKPGEPVLTYTPAEWRDFLGGVRLGEFDAFGQTPTDAGG